MHAKATEFQLNHSSLNFWMNSSGYFYLLFGSYVVIISGIEDLLNEQIRQSE